LLAGLLHWPALSQGAADLHVIARTGQAGLTTINTAISVNNAGLVAFSGVTAAGRGSFVADAGGPRAVLPIGTGSLVQANVQINDAGLLVAQRGAFFFTQDPIYYYDPILGWILIVPGYTDSYDFVQTWTADGLGNMNLIAEGRSRTDAQTFQTYKVGPFSSAGWDVSINNAGQVVFLADQGSGFTSDYVIATPNGSAFNTYPAWAAASPMLADDGHIVLRSGVAANSSILLLNYALTTPVTIASTAQGFTSLGGMPGISDDGQFIAFYGDLSAAGAAILGTTAGPGIFLSLPVAGARQIIRVAGLSAAGCSSSITGFQANMRIGVNTQPNGEALVVFVANQATGMGVFCARYKPGASGSTAPVPVVLQGDTVDGIGPFTQFALYDSVNTGGQVAIWASGGGVSAVLFGPAPPRVPVVLVHGWRGSPGTWANLTNSLATNGIDYILVDYSPGTGDPRVYAQKVAGAITTRRNAGYAGKFDIVCHSMGAMVSRWYMEEQNHGADIREWIGIAPVNQGAALANYPEYLSVLAWVASAAIEDVRSDGAVTEMRTGSDTVSRLKAASRVPGVIYRNIVGYNCCAWTIPPTPCTCLGSLSINFPNQFETRGKTVASIDDELGHNHPHAWTYFGDGIVALVQSELPGSVSTDCFMNQGHTSLPTNAPVVAQVVKYLLNPCADSLNNYPLRSDLLRDADVQVFGPGNQAYIFRSAPQTKDISVDSSAAKMRTSLTYHGSKLALSLYSPSGAQMVPGTYPVSDYGDETNSIWFTVESPEPGIWHAVIDPIDVPVVGEPYSLTTFFSSPFELTLLADTGGTIAQPGRPVLLRATLLNSQTPVTGAVATAQITAPDGSVQSLNLYDDATHGDAAPSDGVYSASLTPQLTGQYSVAVSAQTGLVQRSASLQFGAQSQAGPPALLASGTPSGVQISWTAQPGAFLLEGNTNLSNTNWLAEDVVPEVSSNNLHTVILRASGQHYFRLKGQ
jgi:pimeloyl-ACP methyl ester carboxylesterase